MKNSMDIPAIIFILKFSLVFGLSPVVLDKSNDISIFWKIKGDPKYLADGKALRNPDVHPYLPGDFPLKDFEQSKGIWAVFPNDDQSCEEFNMSFEEKECNVTKAATFTFQGKAQLVSSVTVRFNFGGNSSIRITGSRGQPYEESANGASILEWIEITLPLEGSQMKLEAVVYQKEGYVLIDKISVYFQETSTSTKRPRTTKPTTTTTEQPKPAPVGGQDSMFKRFEVISMMFFSMTFLLTLSLFE